MHPTSHTTYPHPATHHYLQTQNGNTVHAYVITGKSETYQGVRPENEAHADDEHMQYIPHGTIPVQHAPCPTSHVSHMHVVNPHDMPEPPTYTAQPHATTNGRENEVGAHGEGLYRTNAGLTATLVALTACIPVHGPPDMFFACHTPVLVHTDPRIAVSHKLTKDAVDSKPHADPQRPTARRATLIDEIDEDLLAHIRGASEERGWQGGWDAGEIHRRAEGYCKGCEVAKCKVSTTSHIPDTVSPAAHPTMPSTPHSDSTHSVPRPSPIEQSPAPGFEPGLSLTTPADEPREAHDANANSVSTSNDVRPQWATSLFELNPNLFHKILDQGKRKGRKAGRIEGREEGYKEGHEEGYREGHEDGLKEGLVQAAERQEEGFREGWGIGKKRGMLEGREKGFQEGKSIGLKTGRVLILAEVHDISLISAAVQTAALHSPPHADMFLQTDSTTAHADASLQTEDTPDVQLPPVPMHIESAAQTMATMSLY
ncbi:hypothetical protein EWM64_g5574 [Hericium alpestre]|uniref:Essential protein Yae1 N-terminal domain-containing protein n=1 Tax=Hericium alpestre TaxID=135208 RepID=A0A4Y9ZYE0_9AGAM|nr:hypothetical protein EWM64_g5574 [Hericium alpestre]